MNVLFIGIRENEDETTSGPKKVANILFNRILEKHKNTYFYGLTWEDKIEQNSSEFQILNNNEAKGNLVNLVKFIKYKDINVVYLARYYSLLVIFLLFIKPIYKFKLVYTVHGIIKKEKAINNSFKFYSVIFEKMLLKNADKIIVITHALKNELIKCYPDISREKISIVNNGVELIPIERKVDIRKLYNISYENNILFTVGTRKIKNIESIIENFIKDGELYNSSFLLIAGEIDTEYAKKLKAKYKSLEKIKFIGSVDTNMMNNIYSQCDLYIQISEFETFGISMIEALLHKKNIIISSSLPISEYFTEDEVRFYYKEKDDLRNIIKLSLSKKDIANESGCEKATYLFNWHKIAEEYYKIFSHVYAEN